MGNKSIVSTLVIIAILIIIFLIPLSTTREYVCNSSLDAGQTRYSLILGELSDFKEKKDIYNSSTNTDSFSVIISCVGDYIDAKLYVL